MTNTLELEIQMLKAGISKRDLAKALNISEMALFNKLKNVTEFKASEIVKISELLNLTADVRDSIFFAQNVI